MIKVTDHVGFVPQWSTDKIGDLSTDNCEILCVLSLRIAPTIINNNNNNNNNNNY